MRNLFGIIDDKKGSFKEFFLKNNMPEIISKLKNNLDNKSLKIVDKCLHRMLHFPDVSKRLEFFVDDNFVFKYETDEEKFFRELYEVSLKDYSSKYNLDGDAYNVDTFLFHHGLYFANNNIKNYVKGKYFIDGGSYIGDSVLIMQDYNPLKVFSFDLSKVHEEKFYKIMELNSIPSDKFMFFRKGLSNTDGEMNFKDDSNQGTTLCNSGNDKIETTSIDILRKELDKPIGFIKSDVEGFGYQALEGMKNTIITDRPILSLSIYHCPEEFFFMKPFLEEITKNLNYKIEIQHYHTFIDYLVEVAIFAYPKELEGQDNADVIIKKISKHPLSKTLRFLFL